MRAKSCYAAFMSKQPQPAAVMRHSILLVDDDDRVRNALTRFLQHSHEWDLVDAVCDGASAVQRAAELHPDVVLLDFWLPDGNAAVFLPRLRTLDPPPLVVVLTGDSTAAIHEQALLWGAAACLHKLLDPDDMLYELRLIRDRLSR